MKYPPILIHSFFVFMLVSCDPLVTEFSSKENPKEYTAKTLVTPPNKDTLTVVTWNIRFGIGRVNWFGDSCGDLLFHHQTTPNPHKNLQTSLRAQCQTGYSM